MKHTFLIFLALLLSACAIAVDVCGDGICGPTETSLSCPADCQLSCIDSDGGLNYFESGVVRLASGETFHDYCANSDFLVEYACASDGSLIEQRVNCKTYDGYCQNGKCVSLEEFCEPTRYTFIDENNEIQTFTLTQPVISTITTPNMYHISSQNQVLMSSIMPQAIHQNKNNQRMNEYIVVFDAKPIAQIYSQYRVYLELPHTITVGEINVDFDGRSIQSIRAEFETKAAQQYREIQNLHDRIKAVVGDSRVLNTYSRSIVAAHVYANENEIALLRNTPGVTAVYRNEPVSVLLSESVDQIFATQVHTMLDSNGQPITGKGVVVGVLDTGIDHMHPSLGGCIGPNCKVIQSLDFTGTIKTDGRDDQGHGTHVAATIAGSGPLMGVAPDASLVSYKVLDSDGMGWTVDIISAIEHAMDPKGDNSFERVVDIISLSLGNWDTSSTNPLSLAVDAAVESGIVAVVAAGNSGSSYMTVGSPGTSKRAITVGAVDRYNTIASFSSRGPTSDYYPKPDIVAPGVSICAAQWENAFRGQGDTDCNDDDLHVAISGTSMATPHVSGVAALILQQNPDLTPEQVKSKIMHSATKYDYYDSLAVGTGIVNASKAVQQTVTFEPARIHLENGVLQDIVSLNVTNFGNESVTFSFQTTVTSNTGLDFTDIYVQAIDSPCISPGESQSIEIEVGIEDTSIKGLHTSTLIVEQKICNTSTIIDELLVPVSIEHFDELTIEVITGFDHNAIEQNFYIDFFNSIYVIDIQSNSLISTFYDAVGNVSIKFNAENEVLIGYLSTYIDWNENIFDNNMALFNITDLYLTIDETKKQKVSYAIPEKLSNFVVLSDGLSISYRDISIGQSFGHATICSQNVPKLSYYFMGDRNLIDAQVIAELGQVPYFSFNSPELYHLVSSRHNDEYIFEFNFEELNTYYIRKNTSLIPNDGGFMTGGLGPIPEGARMAGFWSGSHDFVGKTQDVHEQKLFISPFYKGLFAGVFVEQNNEDRDIEMYSQIYVNFYNIDDEIFFMKNPDYPKLEIFEDSWTNEQFIQIVLPSGSQSQSNADKEFEYIFIDGFNWNTFNYLENMFHITVEEPNQVFETTIDEPFFINCNAYEIYNNPQISCTQGTYRFTVDFSNFDSRFTTFTNTLCFNGDIWYHGRCTRNDNR